jgi:hypothetical protein
VTCFNNQKVNAFDPNLLEPLLKVLRLSPSLSASLAKPETFAGIAQKLGHKKAVVRLNLLRLVRNILDAREADYFSSADKHLQTLLDDIQTLADKDSAVLVRNLASELVRSHINGESDNGIPTSSASSTGSAGRNRTGPRRIYTPPSLHAAGSAPLTPTSSHRASQAAFIEIAASPRRRSVIHPELDPAFYRPRSRDGGAIPMSSLPRRISGDSAASGRSRLPRNSFVQPSPTDLSGGRSQSVLSNKENHLGSRSRYSQSSSGRPSSSYANSGHSREMSGGKQRRSRAPSEGGASRKWAASGA